MKKLLALILCTVMVLAVIPTVTLTASAAGEGDWTVRRSPDDTDPDDYTPAAGYYYDSEGFHTVSPDFTGSTPYYSVVTRDPVNLKDGFSMTFRIDEFAYKGEENKADEWISLTIGETPYLTPGKETHEWGSGWVSLIRGFGDATATLESYWTQAKDADGNAGSGAGFGHLPVECQLDGGRELYVLDVTYTDNTYQLFLNGLRVPGGNDLSNRLKALVDSGDFYIGITFHTGVSGSPAALSILDVNGAVPSGNDSADPEENVRVPAPRADASSVPVNQPALLFDATKSSFNKDPETSNAKIMPKGDNSYAVTPVSSAIFVNWDIRHALNYGAEDFPVFALLVRNCESMGGSLYYLSGDKFAAGEDCRIDWNPYDPDCRLEEIGDDFYNLIVVDFGEKDRDGTPLYDFAGRINGFRVDFGGLITGEEYTFDICYMAAFRSVEECNAYADAYLKIDSKPATDTATKAATDTGVPVSDTETSASTDTAAPQTGEGTGAPESTAATSDTGKKGCSSAVGGATAVVAVMAAATAAVTGKRKRRHIR